MKIDDFVLHEEYLDGATFSGKYDFPVVKASGADPEYEKLQPVPFNQAKYCKDPKHSMCHFFIDDVYIERIWNDPKKYIPMLQNFRYVCSPDFSVFDDMPMSMRIWNTYRNRVMAHFLSENGIRIIPTVEPSGETFDFCFESLPKNSTIACSTNGSATGIFKIQAEKSLRKICEELEPKRIVIVGRDLGFDLPTEVQYFESCGEQLTRKLSNKEV